MATPSGLSRARPWQVRARLLAIIRARIREGVADHNGYKLTDPIDYADADDETATIMAHLFPRKKETP